jgi:cobalt/nickel transport system permease protein
MTFENEFFNLGFLDSLSYKESPVHRLDPRVKLVVTLVFALTVVSFPKYEISGLMPFFLYPALFLALGDIPARFIIKKVIFVSPFALFVGIFNPLLDRMTLYTIGGVAISGGWISFVSIAIKFFLTVSSALLLIATTSFPGLCHAIQKIGLPPIFVSQLLFLYRYIFVLMEETMRVMRARDMRSFGKKGKGAGTAANLIGVLFIRTVERSGRIYNAMLARGFAGKIETSRRYALSSGDIFFAVAAFSAFALLRRYDLAVMLGGLVR